MAINRPPNGKAPTNLNVKPKRVDVNPIGRTGLQEMGGAIYEEYENKLLGERGQKVYIRMRDDDSTIGAILAAIEMLIRQVKWQIVPATLPHDLEVQLQTAQTVLRMEQLRYKAQRDAEMRAAALEAASNPQSPIPDNNGPNPKGVTPPQLAPFALPKAAADIVENIKNIATKNKDNQDNQSTIPPKTPATDKARKQPPNTPTITPPPPGTIETDPRFTMINTGVESFKQEAEKWAQFIRECFNDMEDSWEDVLSEALTFIVFGWSLLEEVYKVRAGETNDPLTTSKYDDGLIGWRTWSVRAQESLYYWEFDPNTGRLVAMHQRPAPSYYEYAIPLEKSLLFRTSTRKGNPEGKSALRNAYRAHYYKRHIEEIEAVGIERDMAGIPIAYAPPDIMLDSANANDKAVFTSLQNLVTGLRQDKRSGIVFPLSYDEKGNVRYKFELAASPGSRQFDTSSVVNRYKVDMAQSLLADVILLGHEKVGSYALASSKNELFVTALTAWIDMILSVINQDGIQRLCRLNNCPSQYYPSMVHDDIEHQDLEVLGTFLKNISLAGAAVLPSPDGSIEKVLLEAASLPVPVQTEASTGL